MIWPCGQLRVALSPSAAVPQTGALPGAPALPTTPPPLGTPPLLALVPATLLVEPAVAEPPPGLAVFSSAGLEEQAWVVAKASATADDAMKRCRMLDCRMARASAQPGSMSSTQKSKVLAAAAAPGTTT